MVPSPPPPFEINNGPLKCGYTFVVASGDFLKGCNSQPRNTIDNCAAGYSMTGSNASCILPVLDHSGVMTWSIVVLVKVTTERSIPSQICMCSGEFQTRSSILLCDSWLLYMASSVKANILQYRMVLLFSSG